METLTRIKVVLEVLLLAGFLILFIHIIRKDGRGAAFGLLTNKP